MRRRSPREANARISNDNIRAWNCAIASILKFECLVSLIRIIPLVVSRIYVEFVDSIFSWIPKRLVVFVMYTVDDTVRFIKVSHI